MKADRPTIAFAITTLMLAGTVVVTGLAAHRVPQPLTLHLDRISSQIGGWTALRDHTLDEPSLHVLAATEYLSRTYQKDNAQLDLFIAFYARQRAGESMHSPKHCLPGAGWEIWKHDSTSVTIDGKNVQINKYSIQNQGARRLMYYWYQSKDRIVASEYLGKILLAKDTLFTGHTAGSIVRVMMPEISGNTEEAAAFAEKVIPEVQRCFGR
jgi:EpsI family protein